jgi:hypothetical protein
VTVLLASTILSTVAFVIFAVAAQYARRQVLSALFAAVAWIFFGATLLIWVWSGPSWKAFTNF